MTTNFFQNEARWMLALLVGAPVLAWAIGFAVACWVMTRTPKDDNAGGPSSQPAAVDAPVCPDPRR